MKSEGWLLRSQSLVLNDTLSQMVQVYALSIWQIRRYESHPCLMNCAVWSAWLELVTFWVNWFTFVIHIHRTPYQVWKLSQSRKLHSEWKGRMDMVPSTLCTFKSRKILLILLNGFFSPIAPWLRRLTFWATCCRLIHPYATCSYVCLRSTAQFSPLSCLACHQGNNNILETIISTCKGLYPTFSHRLQH
jgi:hypothetical protein